MSLLLRPPALDLPAAGSVRWTSFTKVIREPEQNWPADILDRPVVTGRIGQRAMALVADPEAAREVLTGPASRFVKWRIYSRVVGAGAGRHNISATEGASNQRQRRAFAPMFRTEAVAGFSSLFQGAAARAVAEWRGAGGPLRIDAGLAMTRLTLDVMWRLVFAAPAERPAGDTVDAVARQVYAAQLGGRINDTAAPLESLVREAAVPPFADLAQGGGLSAQELHDNARLFLNAGHETTALTLTWALWLIGQDPEAQARVHVELDAGGPTAFTEQVISEAMRLFPPAPIIVRQAVGEETLCGQRLPAGAIWAVCPYALHRHNLLWREPALFRPGRFAPGSGEPRHRYAFLPFSAGRHACIGAAFGWAEAVAVFAAILRAFEVEADLSVPVRPRMAITLRPDGEAPVTLRPRCAVERG